MRKILVSIFTIVLVASAAVVTTGAYFTDQVVSANNSGRAGKLYLKLTGEVSPTFTVTKLEPGQWATPINMGVENESNDHGLAFKYRFTSVYASQTKPGFYNKLTLKVWQYANGSWRERYSGLLKDLSISADDFTSMRNLLNGREHLWRWQIGLDSSAGDVFQGAKATFNIVADATQTTNTGWSE